MKEEAKTLELFWEKRTIVLTRFDGLQGAACQKIIFKKLLG